MPTKQESIVFPIRKAKSSRSKSGKSAEQTERQDVKTGSYNCPEVSDKMIDTTAAISPLVLSTTRGLRERRSSSRAEAAISGTRKSSRKKGSPINYCETSLSPLKKINVHSTELCTSKKLTFEGESLPECVSPSHDFSTSVTPCKNMNTTRSVSVLSAKRDYQASYREVSASPKRPQMRGRESSVQDEKFSTPKKLLPGKELSPEGILPHACPGASCRSVTPSRKSRSEEKDQEHQTPTKRKILLPDAEACLSPSKRLVVVLKGIPKEYSDQHPSLLSPSKSPKASALPVSKETEQSTPVSPVQKGSSGTSVTTDSPTPKMEKPMSSVVPLPDVPLTPDRTPQHYKVECRSPPRSAVKRLNMNSPVKSPMKPLVLASPRRSPRKLNNENMASPQRLRKNEPQSPLRFSSPSSLVSRLTLASPSTSKKSLAVGLFKPSVSAYRSLRQSLNTGTPSVLVCREKQTDEIQEFLKHHLTQGKPGSLYISGAPGTGKTASLNSNLENLGVKKMKKIFLNCMTLKTAAAIYKAIASELNLNVSNSEKENRNAIERVITSRKPILLMLDEVDQLDSKHQEVLYTIFEWPALPGSSLVMVGIANSLDLTDRILPRLQALPNCRPKLLHFPPYSKAEIVKIINHRIKEADLGDVQIIRPAAIQLLAGKVASIAGDVRKALDVCRRAVELCEGQARRQAVLKPSNGSPQKAAQKPVDSLVPRMVEIPQILSIFNEVYGSRVVSAVTNAPESFPLQQKVLVCCLLLILKYARSKDVTLGKFHEVYTRVCKKQQVPGTDQTEFLSLCTLLEARGMLQVKRNKEIRSSKVVLLLNEREAEDILGDRNLLATILEDRESLGKLCSQLKR